jgi:hypothetical protein
MHIYDIERRHLFAGVKPTKLKLKWQTAANCKVRGEKDRIIEGKMCLGDDDVKHVVFKMFRNDAARKGN